MRARDAATLAALVLLRVLLSAARLTAAPARFVNFEESYNATVAWLLTRAPLAAHTLDLQYRSFCGGCSVVTLLGAPLMAGGDEFWRWKVLALLWTAATQIVGFFALDAWIGRAAAWAFALVFAVPTLGGLDLSLMLWGNHQESALFALLGLLCLARGWAGSLGFVMGFAVWFTRTAAYEALVLVPAALWALRGQRLRVVLGFAAGLALIAVPSAGGDAGWYRMADAVSGQPASMTKRAATLFAPASLAGRLWLPLRDMAPAAAVWLAASGVALWWTRRDSRARVVAAFALAYAAAYIGTKFPIFLIGASSPVNNIRYHAPWAFTLTLLVAAGVGTAWAQGRRRLAASVLVAILAVDGTGLVRVAWRPDPSAWALSAINLPQFVLTATPRLTAAALDVQASDPRADEALRRMRGLVLGHSALEATAANAYAAADGDGVVLAGIGEALVEPCSDAATVARLLAASDDPVFVGRGMSVTLGLCPAPFQLGDVEAVASAAGPTRVNRCRGAASRDLSVLGTCLFQSVAGERFADEILYGAGRFWWDNSRSEADLAAIAAPLGPLAHAFVAGTHDPAAGTRIPTFARATAQPPPGPAAR